MKIYELAILGAPSPAAAERFVESVTEIVQPFGLNVGVEVAVAEGGNFSPDPTLASAAVFFGGDATPQRYLHDLVAAGVPVIPVVSTSHRISEQLPLELRHVNAMVMPAPGESFSKLAAVALECVGLLPRQRRVFLSYRRDEARHVAVQLFEAFSARHFDVFLDTHGVRPAEDFQTVLWHRLCDSDVLVMLDTRTYFESRWTAAEYGRAMAKSLTVLRLGWPAVTPSTRIQISKSIQLRDDDLINDRLSDELIGQVCLELEVLRSKSIAIRHIEITSALRLAMQRLGGVIESVGQRRSVVMRLRDSRRIVAYPTVGVPTAETLYDAATHCANGPAAIVYDPIGLSPRWQGHLTWLAKQVAAARLVASYEAAWVFADWTS